MSDPLSPLASVLTLAGSATLFVEVLVTFFREFRNAPTEVHAWLTMLEYLRTALSSLEQSSRNSESGYHFSSQFQQRLLSCVNQLQVCASEVARIDADLGTAKFTGVKKWDHRARRSWERAKWAIVGGQKMKKVMQTMQLYHFEFGMELLKMLL